MGAGPELGLCWDMSLHRSTGIPDGTGSLPWPETGSVQGHSSGPKWNQRTKRAGIVVGTCSLFLELRVSHHHLGFLWTGAGACSCAVQVIACPGGLACLAPMSKFSRFDRIWKILHEMSICLTNSAGCLPFGKSFESRIHWRGPDMVEELQLEEKRLSGPGRC